MKNLLDFLTQWESLRQNFKTMSAYNTVIFPWKDPDSKKEYNLSIQFKYGDVWQYEFKIGDTLKWGGNDNGNPLAKKVVVEGILEGKKLTNKMPEDFEIHISNNKIISVVPSTYLYDY